MDPSLIGGLIALGMAFGLIVSFTFGIVVGLRLQSGRGDVVYLDVADAADMQAAQVEGWARLAEQQPSWRNAHLN